MTRWRMYIAAAAAASGSQTADAFEYRCVFLGELGSYSECKAISADGMIQGGFLSARGGLAATVWRGNSSRASGLHPAGWTSSVITAITDEGLTAGYAVREVGQVQTIHAFLFDEFHGTDLHPFPEGNSWINGISPDGSVQVGEMLRLPGERSAARWQGSRDSFLSLSLGVGSAAYSASNKGAVISGVTSPNAGLGNGEGVIWDKNGSNRIIGTSSILKISGDGQWAITDSESGGGTRIGSLLNLQSREVFYLQPIEQGENSSPISLSRNGSWACGLSGLIAHPPKAVVWRTKSLEVINLHSFLPADYAMSSAQDVDNFGNVVGAASKPGMPLRAVMWVRLSSFAHVSSPEALGALRNPNNWQSSPILSFGQYFKWSDSNSLPESSQAEWNGVANMTRVTHPGSDPPSGQCTEFVRALTGLGATTCWHPGLRLINSTALDSLIPGDAIALFNGSKYAGHTAIYLRTMPDGRSVEVADQNFVSGQNHARVVGRHHQIRFGGTNFSNLANYAAIAAE